MNFISKNKTLSFSFFAGILIIVLQIFRWELFNSLFIFELLIETGVTVLFIASIIFSVVFLLKSNIKKSKKALAPIFINVITVLIIFFVPFTNILLDIDFFINKKAREEIVNLVQSELLKPNVSYNPRSIKLPDKYKKLSRGGEIVLEEIEEDRAVLFYTFRGVLDNYSGFVYCPELNSDCTTSFVDKGELLQSEKISDHWYWVASH